MAKWILVIFKMIPKEQVVKLLVSIFELLAKKTDNTIDDDAVAMIKAILETAFSEK